MPLTSPGRTGFPFLFPGTPVPIVLQNMMPILASGLLGGFYGTASTALFLIAGLLGLPVFSGGRGGIAHLLGPTGGFLIGYLAAAAFLIIFFRKPGAKDLALVSSGKNNSIKLINYLKIIAASFFRLCSYLCFWDSKIYAAYKQRAF